MSSVVDTFYAIDFDRCLSDTPKLDALFYELAAEYPQLDAHELLKARNAVEDQGISFDQVAALRKNLTETELTEFFDEFTKRASSHDILADGAHDLLDRLDKKQIPFGIVSYGDVYWQTIKINASGVQGVSTLITDHKRKAEVIAGWQQSDSTFLLAESLAIDTTYAKHIVLLDDKAIAFSGLPIEARGYWVQSVSGVLLPAQQGTVPDNVRIARGLGEVITFESL